jgi:cysteinyl-tRNA synthetase
MRFDAMDLKLYDTLTREKRVFKPLDAANVRMYVCGPTVYDFAHIGNARPVIVFDVLFRLLRHIYGADHVTYVRNITDVDDKINARAAERNITIQKLTDETYKNFKDDVRALGCLDPSYEPRATEYVRRSDNNIDMVRLIESLVGSQNAYVEQDHVLFHVPSMPDYGQLSRRSLDEMIAGARVEVAPYKRNPMDFVLWKPSDEGQANYPLPKWKSPYGIATPGRPGWHIECSAMSAALLGETFDIHGGGIDLLFPHHENEIAQSRCAFHSRFMARYWMHNGFLQVEGEKMSKSLGNFVTIRELLLNWPGDVLRLTMLRTHYRQPIDWTKDGLLNSLKDLQIWTDFVAPYIGAGSHLDASIGEIDGGVIEALSDDLNTPLALSRVHKLYEAAKRNSALIPDFVATLLALGFRHLSKPGFFHPSFGANLFESGPQIGPEEMREIHLYRMAIANNFPILANSTKKNLESAGFIIKINDAGTLFVGNKTSAEMSESGRDPEASLEAKVQELIALRNAARQAKDFDESDRIRDELLAMGIILKDTKDGTTWEIAR